MQLRRNKSEQAEVAAESMNDIMFFLMLFFLIISTLATPSSIKVALPNAEVSKQMSKMPVVLTVKFGGNDTKQYFIGNETTVLGLPEVEAKLKEMLKEIQDPTLVLRMESTMTKKDLYEMLDLGSRLKVKTVLATDNKQS